ncbi:MAG: AAA family ATPase [Acidimicrobiales bacterium]
MRLTRVHLENYRVYEDPVDIEIPPGLVGVYGPNGAGKSYFIESILWTLFGRSRTTKDEIRTAGSKAECLTEVEFEHEGHLYLVRRRLGGVTATIRAEAMANGTQVADGARDVGRYVHSILGMDDVAFRASVFAEQKQLAAFSSSAPAERRRLVLGLLGITALDGAREQARKDARDAKNDLDRLNATLPDLDALEADLTQAEAERSRAVQEARAREHECARAEVAHQESEERHRQLDERGRTYDLLVSEGKTKRKELDQVMGRLARLEAERVELGTARAELDRLEPLALTVDSIQARLDLVRAANLARDALAGLGPALTPPPRPDPESVDKANQALDGARAARAGAQARVLAARAEWTRASELAVAASALSGEADCPMCGQALGLAFAQVQAHRQNEVATAKLRWDEEEANLIRVEAEEAELARLASSATQALVEAQKDWTEYEKKDTRRGEAQARWETACANAGGAPEADEEADLTARLALARQAASDRANLEGRLSRLDHLKADQDRERLAASALQSSLEELRQAVRDLGYQPQERDKAQMAMTEARRGLETLRTAWMTAQSALAATGAQAQVAAARLTDAQSHHHRVADISERARHLGRLAELMNSFRNAVVSAIGPRLSVQAADLFAELTDREYDLLVVDPETYEIRIQDQGQLFGMDRFSGSETDLANLALRVAISEHLRFQSGGSVGLLVLDEVFGPLDDDRKDRMLVGLERLRARFRQVLVVTHDNSIKEQLPHAIEVIKKPGRRAGLRLV